MWNGSYTDKLNRNNVSRSRKFRCNLLCSSPHIVECEGRSDLFCLCVCLFVTNLKCFVSAENLQGPHVFAQFYPFRSHMQLDILFLLHLNLFCFWVRSPVLTDFQHLLPLACQRLGPCSEFYSIPGYKCR